MKSEKRYKMNYINSFFRKELSYLFDYERYYHDDIEEQFEKGLHEILECYKKNSR